MANEQLIFDVGAHKGEDTEFYLKKGFTVVAVEAVAEFCGLLETRFASAVRDGRLRILNVAVSSRARVVDFYVNQDKSDWGTTNPEWVGRNRMLGAPRVRKVTVPARPLKEIVEAYGVPRYCKIDIEGNDLDAIRSLVGCPDLPDYISLESDKRDWSRLMQEILTLHELGYRRFKILDQTLVPLQSCPSPPREGRHCEHAFEYGSSGLFGEELPGTWLALNEAVEAYRQIFRGYALNGDNGLFRRGNGLFSVFYALGSVQRRLARARSIPGYANPAEILPSVAWYDTHAGR